MAAIQSTIDEEDFTVRNSKEINQIINSLIEDKASLRITFNQGNEDYLTNIISMDEDAGHIYLDMTVDDVFNQRMLNSGRLLIIKDGGVRIKWKTNQHTQAALSDGKALRIDIPKELVRIQRRQLFRLKTPVARPLTCEIPIANLINPRKTDKLVYNLVDVSLGGVGLIVPTTVHPSIEIGKMFDQCKIDFPDVGEANLTLEVRNIIDLSQDGNNKYRLGMQYIRPTRPNENIIHRYTFELERAALAARNQQSN